MNEIYIFSYQEEQGVSAVHSEFHLPYSPSTTFSIIFQKWLLRRLPWVKPRILSHRRARWDSKSSRNFPGSLMVIQAWSLEISYPHILFFESGQRDPRGHFPMTELFFLWTTIILLKPWLLIMLCYLQRLSQELSYLSVKWLSNLRHYLGSTTQGEKKPR